MPNNNSQHQWWVFSTALKQGWLMLICAKTGKTGSVRDPSSKEWDEAFHAPSNPYRWYDENRVVIDPGEVTESIDIKFDRLYKRCVARNISLPKIMILICIIGLTIAAGIVFAAERDYQQAWCQGRGETEHVLPDRTRVDCLTEHYAIEFDFAYKWAEAIGQALYYSSVTGKQPGIVLIIRDPDECRFLDRARRTITAQNLNIQLWTTPLDCPL